MRSYYTRKFLLGSLFCFFWAGKGFGQGVGINTDNSTADPSAILDIKATDKGVLIPRVALTNTSTASPVASPATALMVYNTATAGDVTPGFYFWNGTAWVRVQTGNVNWNLSGNTGTTAGTDFIGTADNVDLVLKTNNTEKTRLTAKGALEVGQGTANNVFIGKNAGLNTDLSNANVISIPNTFIGHQAGQNNTVGYGNYFSGYQAGMNNSTATGNYFSGYQAGMNNTIGSNNHFVGFQAGIQNTTGSSNYFSGFAAGTNNTTGSGNYASGFGASFANTTGIDNYASGNGAGFNNTTGSSNYFSGFQAGQNNTTASNNYFSGYRAGYSNTTGNNNYASGFGAGFGNTTGSSNYFSGFQAGQNNSTGGSNYFSGFQAGFNNTTASNNHFSGYGAGFSNTTGANNLFVGYLAGRENTTGVANQFIGYLAGRNNTTGQQNHFVGYAAGFNNTIGGNNSFSGYNAGAGNTTGNNNYFSGYSAGLGNTTGNNNIAVGYQAGDNITTGSNNLIIGYAIDAPSATGSNQMSIGNLIYGTGLNGTGTTPSTGKVGIGMSSPNGRLQLVNEDFNRKLVLHEVANDNTQFFGLGINYAGGGSMRYQIGNASSYNAWYAATGANTETELMRLTGAGNVGIGTTAPNARLTVVEGSATNAVAVFQNTATSGYSEFIMKDDAGTARLGIGYANSGAGVNPGTSYVSVGNNDFIIKTNNAERTRITSTGNMGIGTATPAARFSVGTNSEFQVNATGNIAKINNVATSFPATQGAANTVLTNDGAGNLSWTAPSGTATFGDVKTGIQATDHNGWVKLDGRAINTLTASQQAQAATLGLGANLPNATDAYLVQNGSTLGSVSGSNSRTIAQNQLPNISLDWRHTHKHRGYYTTSTSGSNQVRSRSTIGSDPEDTLGSQEGSIWYLNGNVTQQAVDIKPQSLSVNTFIYLGL